MCRGVSGVGSHRGGIRVTGAPLHSGVRDVGERGAEKRERGSRGPGGLMVENWDRQEGNHGKMRVLKIVCRELVVVAGGRWWEAVPGQPDI